MSNTTNLDLERPDKGDTDWHTSLNSNMTKLDTGYGNNVASIADLPEVYIETGTFNYLTGDTITLPKSVDSINEYNVSVIATTRAGAIGDIWVSKTTSDFAVKCSENNTTDTFAAIIYYIGDINNYGGSIYRKWYVSPDASITNHGDDTDTGSFAWVLDQIGASSAAVEFPANKAYTISTTATSPANVHLILNRGAVLTDDGSNADLTINGTLEAGLYQIFNWGNGTGTLTFANGMAKEYFPQWAGAPVNGSDNDLVAAQQIADSMTSGLLRFTAGDWTFTTMASFTSANTGSENGQLIIANEISIKGDGRNHSIITSTLDDTYYGSIVVNGVNGVTIDGIALVGTGTAYSSNYGGGIRVLLSKDTVIKNCLLEDIRGIGINFVGNFNLAVGDTDVAYYCTGGIVDGNILRNINGDGIYHIFSRYNHTINNILNNCGYTDSIIYEASDRSTIANNIILYPNERSILLNAGSSYCTVTGNTTYHYDAATVYSSIALVDVVKNVISGNIVEYASTGGSPKRGIEMYPGASAVEDTYHSIVGNIIINGGSSTSYGALHVQTNYNTINGNKLISGTHGIMVDDANYNQISNNHIVDNDGNGIRLSGIDGRDDPTYTFIIGNWVSAVSDGIYVGDGCTNTTIVNNNVDNDMYIDASSTVNIIHGNTPNTEILTTGSPTLSRYYDSATIDSSGGAVTGTLGSGFYVGQIKTIVMTEASTPSTISITNHETSDPEVATFDAVDETGIFMWTGTEWVTIKATCTFV